MNSIINIVNRICWWKLNLYRKEKKVCELNEEQIDRVITEFLKQPIMVIGRNVEVKDPLSNTIDFYNIIRGISANLGFAGSKEAIKIGIYPELGDKTIRIIIEKIWEFLNEGILSPGIDKNNPWFPFLHLTKKGNEYIEGRSQTI